MLYYIKKYPFSIAIILAVVYLSFFKPPSVEIGTFPGFDKLAHICMYGGLSGVLWFEFIRNHKGKGNHWHAWMGAVVCPVMMSGAIELLQEHATTYRGGDWLDFLANVTGVLLATLIANLVIKPWLLKWKS